MPKTKQPFEPLHKPKHPGGRPTKMTEAVVKKLEEAFAIGATDAEACFYADISKETLYTYQDNNPEFLDRKNALKERPVLVARQTVVKAIESNSDLALKFLERKRKKEFSTRAELTGKDGSDLVKRGMSLEDIEAVLARAKEERKAKAESSQQG